MRNRHGLPVWIPPNKVVYSRLQMILFLLPNLFELREGEYPSEPDEYYCVLPQLGEVYRKRSNYEEPRIKKKKSNKAPFIIAAEIAAEVDKRLSMTPCGHWLIAHYTDGYGVDQIAATSRLSPTTIENEIKTTLKYVSGWKRKRLSFNDYKNGSNLLDRVLALLH